MSKFKVGDKVTVTYEGTYEGTYKGTYNKGGATDMEVFKVRDAKGVRHHYGLTVATIESVPPVPQAGDVWEVGKAGEDGELYFISNDSGSYLTEGLKVTNVGGLSVSLAFLRTTTAGLKFELVYRKGLTDA